MIHIASTVVLPFISSALTFALLASGFFSMLQSTQPAPATSDFFEVHELKACWQDGDVWILFNRTIHQPVPIVASVKLMGQQGAGWVELAETFRPARTYSPDARLPIPDTGKPSGINLDWWAWGDIPVPPQGPEYEIWTEWAPQVSGLTPVKFRTPILESCEVSP